MACLSVYECFICTCVCIVLVFVCVLDKKNVAECGLLCAVSLQDHMPWGLTCVNTVSCSERAKKKAEEAGDGEN